MTDGSPPAAADTGAPPAPAAAPAPAATPSPAPSPTAAPSPAPSPTPAPAAGTFAVPEAYKDKPWAAKIKTADDAWKQLENLQGLVGKKTVAPDFEKATPAEIESYLAQTRPADATAYSFDEKTDPAIKTVLSDALLKNGVTPYQANNVIKAYQEAEKTAVASMFTTEGMHAEFEKSFGAEWKQVSGTTQNIIAANSSAEDKKALDALPNPMLALMLRVVNNVTKSYGIDEKNGAHLKGGKGAPLPQNVEEQRVDLRKQIDALSRKPHTADEKQALVDQLNKTYEQKK